MDISTFIDTQSKSTIAALQNTKDVLHSMDTGCRNSGLRKDYENYLAYLNYLAEVYRLAEIGLQVEVFADE